MTCTSRIRQLRLIEKMERLSQSSDCVKKTEDGTLKYYGSNGNVLIEARMIQKN